MRKHEERVRSCRIDSNKHNRNAAFPCCSRCCRRPKPGTCIIGKLGNHEATCASVSHFCGGKEAAHCIPSICSLHISLYSSLFLPPRNQHRSIVWSASCKIQYVLFLLHFLKTSQQFRTHCDIVCAGDFQSLLKE